MVNDVAQQKRNGSKIVGHLMKGLLYNKGETSLQAVFLNTKEKSIRFHVMYSWNIYRQQYFHVQHVAAAKVPYRRPRTPE